MNCSTKFFFVMTKKFFPGTFRKRPPISALLGTDTVATTALWLSFSWIMLARLLLKESSWSIVKEDQVNESASLKSILVFWSFLIFVSKHLRSVKSWTTLCPCPTMGTSMLEPWGILEQAKSVMARWNTGWLSWARRLSEILWVVLQSVRDITAVRSKHKTTDKCGAKGESWGDWK